MRQTKHTWERKQDREQYGTLQAGQVYFENCLLQLEGMRMRADAYEKRAQIADLNLVRSRHRRSAAPLFSPAMLDKKNSFAAFSHLIDARILRALADMGFATPTPVQAKAIPLALECRDILARARTGSGKTAAYCLPVVQKIISVKTVGMSSVATKHDELIVRPPASTSI